MDSLIRPRADKRDFANRARAFANRARHTLPFPVLELICVAVASLAAISGPFGTGQLPLLPRASFWFVLMAWNAAKWRLWFAWRVRRPADWIPAAAIGSVVLNLLLPGEIAMAFRIIGVEVEIARLAVWPQALAISAIVFVIARAVRRPQVAERPAEAPLPGPLSRAGFHLEHIVALRAEDHYCRLYLADGSTRLVLCRFGDALGELASLDGARIHRGAWLANRAVERAERVGRAWRLIAAGEAFPVSAAHVAAARQRGWLNRR